MLGSVTVPKWFLVCGAVGFLIIGLIKLVFLVKYCIRRRNNRIQLQKYDREQKDLERNQYLNQRLSIMTLSEECAQDNNNDRYDKQSVAQYDCQSIANEFDDPSFAIESMNKKPNNREGRTFSWGKKNKEQQYADAVYTSYLMHAPQTPFAPVHLVNEIQKMKF